MVFTKGPFIDEICPICLDELSIDNILIYELCGHTICRDCCDEFRV